MKKPITLTWHVRLIITVLCIAVGYLIVEAFIDGYKEGRAMKLKEKEKEHHSAAH